MVAADPVAGALAPVSGEPARPPASTDEVRPALLPGLTAPHLAGQARLWSASIIHEDSAPYVISAAFELRGPVDVNRLAAAVRALPGRQPALTVRYQLVDGQLTLTPDPAAPARLEVRDEPGPGAVAELVADSLAGWAWDLAEPPHLRATVWRLGPEHLLLVVGVHHIAADAWGFDQLMKDLGRLYAGDADRAGPAPGAALPQPADPEAVRRSMAYWHREFAVPPGTLMLPVAGGGAAGAALHGLLRHDEVAFTLRAGAAAGAPGVTPGTAVSALFAAYLAFLAGQDDVSVVYPVPLPGLVSRGAGSDPGAAPPISSMTSLGILRLAVDHELTGAGLLRLAQRKVLAGMRHPYGALEAWAGRRESGTGTLPNVIVQWLRGSDGWLSPAAMAPVEVTKVPTPLWVSEFDLDLWVTGGWDTLSCRLGFRPDRVPPEAVAHLADGFAAFYAAATAAPDVPLRQLPLTGPPATARAPHTPASAPRTGTGAGGFLEAIARQPGDRAAIVTGTATVDYRELTRRVGRWARLLADRGVRSGQRIAVDLAPGTAPEAPYGIWAAGAVYVPLVADLPTARIRYLLDAAGAGTVVTDRPGWYRDNLADVAVIDPAELPAITAGWAAPDADAPAYVVFTSGSTGLPKAVGATHGNLRHGVRAFQEAVAVPAGARIGQTSAAIFDPSLLEMLLAVEVGGCQVVAPGPVRRDPRELARWLAAHHVDFIEATPTVWAELVGPLGGQAHRPRVCASGGEVLTGQLAARIGALGGELWNLYGPSETTIWATAHRCVGGEAADRPGIGRPLPGTEVRVVGPDLRALPPGFVGELLITGPGVTRGYPNDPELTGRRFVTLPGPDGTPRCWYRTGDRVWCGPDGELFFAGRADRQVKLAGKRIDPAEVEFALAGHPGVRTAVVIATEVPGRTGTALCGYVTAGPGGLDRDGVLAYLREQLPRHAVPVALVELAELPRTPTGKVDAGALPPPTEADLLTRGTRFQPPATPTEALVAEAFGQILGASPVGALDDFFELGGTSLSGLRLGRLLESLVGREVPVATIYQGATVQGIATLLDTQER